jgi:hypothetical protein
VLEYYSGMAKLSGKEIQKLARSIVNENPGGIRYSALVEKISQQTPEDSEEYDSWLSMEPRHDISQRDRQTKPRSLHAS